MVLPRHQFKQLGIGKIRETYNHIDEKKKENSKNQIKSLKRRGKLKQKEILNLTL